MFGIGPSEIILIAITLILILLPLAGGILILYWIFKFFSSNRDRKLEARIDALEKQLQEQQKK